MGALVLYAILAKERLSAPLTSDRFEPAFPSGHMGTSSLYAILKHNKFFFVTQRAVYI